MTFPQGGSEYGGYPDLIQPEPHDYKKSLADQLVAIYGTDAADPESTPEKVVDEIRRRGAGNRAKYND